MAHRPIFEQYRNLKPRKRKKFYEANRAALALYEAAERYLKSVLNGHPLPLKRWKDEYAKLSAERGRLCGKCSTLKDRVKDVETVRHYAESFVREAARKSRPMEKIPRTREFER
jgi:predicted nuclease with TOPRIM domain